MYIPHGGIYRYIDILYVYIKCAHDLFALSVLFGSLSVSHTHTTATNTRVLLYF